MTLYQVAKKLKLDPKKYSMKQFAMGMKVEHEHKDLTKGDPLKTAKIVLAHLKELPDYYTRLQKMESTKRKPSA